MAVEDLKEQIARLPEQPGVYLWANTAGQTLYVGKARSLRDRVRSYLGAWGTSPRHDALLSEIASLDVIVTDSVMEALALENNLIKQRSPRYNILLRDDKNYPYLRLTTSEAYPRVLVARSVEEGSGDFYAGPFLPAKLARRAMTLSHKIFGIRSCNEVITGQRARPCLEYDIGRCVAPCVAEICSASAYAAAVTNTRMLLEGRADELARRLRERMTGAAAAERFEEAAQHRDAMRTVQALAERQQKVATARLVERDVFGVKVGPSGSVVQIFAVRDGRVVERLELVADAEALPAGEPGVVAAAITQFYAGRVPPAELDLPVEIDEQEAVEEWLSNLAGRRVRVSTPQRGDRRAMADLATRNAELSYRSRFNENTAAHFEALETLRSVLGLATLPRRIECFDISTIQGSETVAALVVCEDGRMKRSEYRKFRIRSREHEGSDDFAAMREVVQRRYRAVLEAGGPVPGSDSDRRRPRPGHRCLRRAGGDRPVEPGGRGHRQARGAADHARPPRARGAGPRRPGAAPRPTHPRRGASLRRDVPSESALDARPPVRAGRCARHRSAPAARAADAFRQPGRRAPRHARGTDPGCGRQGRGRGD